MKYKYFTLIILCSFFSLQSKAQFYFNRADSVKVFLSNGNELKSPWAGGLNFLQVSDIDLNFDGIMDLFVFDRTGSKVSTFINNGTPNTIDYTYAHEYVSKFPKLESWALLRDYNCDGKMDIFTHTNLGIKVYRNDGNATDGLQFTLVKNELYSYYIDTNPPQNYLNLYVTSTDIPAIYDVDNDGDLDILTFDFAGSRMQFNKNFSLELYGSCDSLNYFMLVDECFGDFSENFNNNSVTLDVCGPADHLPPLVETEETRAIQHSGSCTLCADLNGDTLRDLLLGDISFSTLTYLQNGGTLAAADMVNQEANYPSNTTPLSVPLFPCAFYVDVNNDSVRDLLVSPNANTCSFNDRSLWLYKNTNTDDSANFEFYQQNFLQDMMIEVGEGAYPAFVDFNNDGLTDIVIGNYGYPDLGCTYTSKLTALKNIGTPTQPKFELATKDFAALGALQLRNLVPTFGDLDNDGDIDMIIGASDGRFYYYQNIAAQGLPANYVLNSSLFSSIIGGQYATPQLVDVNRDGKLDVLAGRSQGKLTYYKNIGTPATPIFSADSAIYFFGNIDVTPQNVSVGFSFPHLFDVGGTYHLLVGSADGKLYHYNNIDGNLNGAFNLVTATLQGIYEGERSAPRVFDINNDGEYDMLLGNYSGGLGIYLGNVNAGQQKFNALGFANQVTLFPNPSNESFKIMANDAFSMSDLRIKLFDIQGKVIKEQSFLQGNSTEVSVKDVQAGVYFCQVYNNSFSVIQKIIVQHD